MSFVEHMAANLLSSEVCITPGSSPGTPLLLACILSSDFFSQSVFPDSAVSTLGMP